ncbi:RodZ domain-containing protein [Sporosarcina sp. 179-K 3D1 HS]|uniref:helix-turn-helix domain-containing protein n=1 Tax=Sporosarcina sp. 179-K 3D1 HS TaxID=3232169 RepID=UPI0039A229A0
MTGLGDRLREARTAKGYTLEDLQTITKIQKRYLSGIENEDYSMMPGSFYVRAFIKQYAEAVGVDPDEMLALYKETTPSELPEEDSVQPAAPLRRRRGLKDSRINEAIPKVIVALFIIVIVVVVWILYKSNASTNPNVDVQPEETITTVEKNKPVEQRPNEQADGETEEGTETPDEVPDPEDVEPVQEQTLEHEGINGDDSMYTLTNADTFQLEIKTAGDSWIGVLDSARQERMTPNARTLSAGEQVELDVSDTDRVRIRVGRTQSTEIYVNGELLEYASPKITQNIIIEYKKEQ